MKLMSFATNNPTPGEYVRRASGSAGVPPAVLCVPRSTPRTSKGVPDANGVRVYSAGRPRYPRHAVLLSVRLLIRGGITSLLLSLCIIASSFADARPRLQIINGGNQPIDIFWLKSESERVPNGSVAPGKSTMITTTIGHRFAVVGREDKSEATVTSEVPVQGFRFDPQGRDGIPAFYTQIVRAGGYPIVASAKVNPYALDEAAYLVDLMLAKRPDVRAAIQPRAEYHPDAGWLRGNGRDPAVAKGIEFTNVRIFEPEARRMPNFALHELAHTYHDRFLPQGFGNAEIKAAYEKAKAGGKYDRVERQDSEGRRRMDRAYALASPQEYFAENTEAFFSRNDFFPFVRGELKQHDPEMFELLRKLWGVGDPRAVAPAGK